MEDRSRLTPFSRRAFLATSTALAAAATTRAVDNPPLQRGFPSLRSRPLLTPAGEFRDVSRGTPRPHSLTGDALVSARLTEDAWRLEITTDPQPDPVIKETASLGKALTVDAGNAIDYATLLALGEKHGVKFLKAMQCLNIPAPLGQGLWEGVPLRDVLALCGPLRNVRRIYYWGFHNNDPKQLFRSSLSYSQAMETPPGELPPFLAYRLNGEPISLLRGGPVRMVIPWAHGFKSIKWLQRIVLTNDHRANDTYAEQNNDPESPLKTAAYLDAPPAKINAGESLQIGGSVISGWSGLERVEYSLTRTDQPSQEREIWTEARLAAPPTDWSGILPEGTHPKDILGFDRRTGQPKTWPLRYSMVPWSAILTGLTVGKYSLRARSVDLNGFAQPEPRAVQKSGRNQLEMREFEVV